MSLSPEWPVNGSNDACRPLLIFRHLTKNNLRLLRPGPAISSSDLRRLRQQASHGKLITSVGGRLVCIAKRASKPRKEPRRLLVLTIGEIVSKAGSDKHCALEPARPESTWTAFGELGKTPLVASYELAPRD